MKNNYWKIVFGFLIAAVIFSACEKAQAADESGEVTEVPLFVEDFNGPIDESVWQIAAWVEHDGQTGRERCYSENGFLNMLFIYEPDNTGYDQYLSSAIQTRDEFLYGRWEARIKPSSVPGVLNSLYTIDWDEGAGTRQEIDIEFLTYTFDEDEGRVHFAVHAKDYPSYDTNPDVLIDHNPSADFHVWGFEITPEKISWIMDGMVMKEYRYSENEITIDSPYQLKLNHWSSEHWVNGPPAPNVECRYLIDWIKFYPWEPDQNR